jgi:6-phosphogluconolactonase (cycloisomerase 2 family)
LTTKNRFSSGGSTHSVLTGILTLVYKHYGWQCASYSFTQPILENQSCLKMHNVPLAKWEMNLKRPRLLAYITALALVFWLLAGCNGTMLGPTTSPSSGGNGSGSAPNPGNGGNSPSASRFIYGTPGFETQGLQAGTADSKTGKITPIPGGPFDPGLGQSSMIQTIADPQGRFVYTLEVGASAFGNPIGQPGIGEFKIDQQTGTLNRVQGSPIVFTQRNDNFLAIDGTGHFLYEPNGNVHSTGFDIYAIDQSTGALSKTTSSANVPPVGANSVASRNGFLFNNGNGMVESFSINSQSGQLTAIGAPLSTGGSGGSSALTSDGKFLYVANTTEGTVAIFSVSNSGTLTPVGATFSTGATGIFFATLTPNGKFLYVVFSNSAGQSIKGFAVDPEARKFTAIQGGAINNANTITIDSSGKFAYVTLVTSTNFILATYSIDSGTGALTQMSQVPNPISDDPNDMVVVP